MTAAVPRAILFVCTSNSVRSPIAAAIARSQFGSTVRVESAGVEPRETDPFAVAVMAERGLDIASSQPRSISDVDAMCFDLVVCLTPEAHREVVRKGPAPGTQTEFWPIRDPTIERDLGRSREQVLEAYRAVGDEIEARILASFGRANDPKSLDGA